MKRNINRHAARPPKRRVSDYTGPAIATAVVGWYLFAGPASVQAEPVAGFHHSEIVAEVTPEAQVEYAEQVHPPAIDQPGQILQQTVEADQAAKKATVVARSQAELEAAILADAEALAELKRGKAGTSGGVKNV